MAYEGSGRLPQSDGFMRQEGGYLFIDVAGFVALVQSCAGKAHRVYKRAQIRRILEGFEWIEHYRDKLTGRRVLAEGKIEHEHEMETAVFLAQRDYDVVFAPTGMFKRNEKKFDVFLLRDTIIIEADMKNVSTKNPHNIARRIKEGSEQASRVIVNITSNVKKKILIDGLRKGVQGNKLIEEIILIYKRRMYRLSVSAIESPLAFEVIK